MKIVKPRLFVIPFTVSAADEESAPEKPALRHMLFVGLLSFSLCTAALSLGVLLYESRAADARRKDMCAGLHGVYVPATQECFVGRINLP